MSETLNIIALSRLRRRCFSLPTSGWGLLFCAVFLFFGFTAKASAAAINVYYSVGQNTSDHSSGGSVSITGGLATFSVPQTATNLGVGDRLTAGGNIYYLASKVSTAQWNVVSKLGAVPANLASTAVTSIAHEYASLAAAVTGAKDSTHINNVNLITANIVLNIPCYYDSGPDTSSVVVSSYTTGPSNYIRIYTTTNTSTEVNLSQRHNGKWDNSKYRLETTNSTGIAGSTNYIRIDGLQIGITASIVSVRGISLGGKLQTDTTDIQISNNIIRGNLSGAATDDGAIGGFSYWASASSNVERIWNNIIYGFVNGSAGSAIGIRLSGFIAYIYNNTIVNVGSGMRVNENGAVLVLKNNIVQNSTIFGYNGTVITSSTNNISDRADAPGSNPKNSTNVVFRNVQNNDYHLLSQDTNAKDAGVDLSSDPNLAFNTDLDGETRPYGSAWDIGADEMSYVQSDFIIPSVTSFNLPPTYTNVTVPVNAFTATDNIGVVGYLITESSSTPLLTNPNWSSSTPATFTFAGAGNRIAYAWARDLDGNISLSANASSNISIPAINIYYSVGQATTTLQTGSPTITITGGIGVFSVPQIGNIGVGDAVTYNTNQIAYISGKTDLDQMHWSLITATGAPATNISSSTVVSIMRAFNNLASATSGGANNSTHLNTYNLATGNYILNIPCYFDNGPDTIAETTASWTTGPSNYIRIYTPTSTSSEANLSQRHNGKWDNSKYRLETINSNGINTATNYIRIDGLQIKVTATNKFVYAIQAMGKLITDSTDIRISNNIIQGSLSGSAIDNSAIGGYWPGISANVVNIWNNIIYNFINGTGADNAIRIAGSNIYAYNNTIVNVYYGIRADSGYPNVVVVAKNNIVQNANNGFVGSFDASSDYNISDISGNAPGSHSKNSTNVIFKNVDDYHLFYQDTNAKDAGVDLSLDSNLVFNTDIDAEARPYGSAWDIGADEMSYSQTDFIAPTITLFTLPATSNSLTVPITVFTATDNVGVMDYLITESAATPSLLNANWSSSTLSSFTFSGVGTRTAYAWARDLDWNISSTVSQTVNITLPSVTYYVDSIGGNDSNTGTSTSQAWQTIAKVNSSTFSPGNQILFKRGGIWREQLVVSSSGVDGAPIVFDAYGSGAKPIISGADSVNVWTIYNGSIYVASTSPTNIPNQLYTDKTFHDIAHYPNSGWLKATANSTDTTSIIDSNLTLATNQILGASILARAVNWNISTTVATAYDPAAHKITVSGNVYGTTQFRTGWGFYLQNMLWMLDSPGEWFYDSVAHNLYLWMPNGDDPTTHTVEVSNRSYGIYDNGNNYITIQNLSVNNANQYDVYTSNANNITVNKLDVSGGQVGIYLSNASNSSVSNNSVQNTLSNGIQVTGTGSTNTISYNTVDHAGNTGTSPKQQASGVSMGSTNTTVANNNIANSGYAGIIFYGSQNLIQNNIVDHSCLVLDDCGGVYTNAPFNTISGNTITNTISNPSGTPHTSTLAISIYLDDLSHDISVLNNTVFNADWGIFIHTGWNNTITGNIANGNRISGMVLYKSTQGALPGSVHNNIITGNTFETIGTGGTASYNNGIDTDNPINFGVFDYNNYYHPNSTYTVSSQNINYTLPAWQQFSGQDLHSTDSSFAYNPITINNPDATPTQSKTITASTTGNTTLFYAVNNPGVNICGASLAFISYSPTSFNSEADNGKKVCFKAQDPSGNISFYLLSNAIAGVTPFSSGPGTSGGGGGVPPPEIPAIPSTTAPPSTLPNPPTLPPVVPPGLNIPRSSNANLRLINDNGTYYLIIDGVKHGITDPGILNSFGFSLSDAELSTPADNLIPQGSLLLPGDGALIKTAQDPTVYLVSLRQRYGFTSASVFLGLGFKFSSVLIITNPELQALPLAINLSDPNAAHLPGVSINSKGTVYRVGQDNLRHPYPSLAIYNTWNIDNDFSRVVPANTADLLIPVGEEVVGRVVN